ncbi:hypothetical protein [Kribbella deserti]|uniref:Uncharacterized protein n=1 Tax=Kribbella deserti TaxID=1926257 RepID=A0ABV6QJN4_9ACTN
MPASRLARTIFPAHGELRWLMASFFPAYDELRGVRRARSVGSVKTMANPAKVLSFLTLVIGGGAGFGLLTLTRRAWDTCNVQINDVGNGVTLLFVGLPVAMVVNMVLFNVVFRISQRGKAGGKFFKPLLAALIAIAIADLALFSWAGTPAWLPSPLCPANVPPWWPTSLPT